MPKPAKILHHVKLTVASLSIANSNEQNLDLVIKTLCTNYKEYNLEPTGQLRTAVSKALVSVIETMNIQLSSKVMSLNQMVSNQYRNASSKRQRPAESDESLCDPDREDVIAVDDVNQVRVSALHRRSSSDSSDVAAVGNAVQLKENDTSESFSNERGVESAINGTANAVSSLSEPSSSRKKSKRRGSSLKDENNNKNHVLDEENNKNDVESDIVKAIMSKNRHGPPEFVIPRPNTRLSDMAGIDSITSQVRELVFYPVLYPGLYNYLGVQPPCGLLLHGPSGCGKTSLAYAIAGELGLPFFKASGPELIGGTSGESEERIRNIFMAAAAKAPSVLFIDALDVIAGKKTDRGMDRRIVAQLFDSIDSLIKLGEENLTSTGSDNSNGNGEGDCNVGFVKSKQGLVVLIAATNKADSLDAGVRGRFSRELSLPVPDASSRTKILGLMTARMKLAIDVDLKELGRLTPGFVGADLKALAREAGMLAVSRIVDKNKDDKEFLKRSHGNGSSSSSQLGTTADMSTDLHSSVGEEEEESISWEISTKSCNNESTSSLDVATNSVVSNEGVTKCLNGINEIDGIVPVIIKAEDDSIVDRKTEELQNEQFQQSKSANGIISQSDNSLPISLKIEKDASELPLINDKDYHVKPVDITETEATVAVGMADFLSAAKSVQPSAKREGFAVVPDVTWGDVGALSEVREELLHNVLEPIAHPERFRSLGLEVPAGVLFFGPPGCGKTLLAKALANQSGANFISVKGPELLNMYVGESESRVRQVFSRARASAPCVIFFDELDALCPRRGSGAEGGSGVSERVVNQLLTELDGLETRKDVYIIAATNRLELIDEAMLRPGRLGKLLYVPLPDTNDRIAILSALVRNVSIDRENIDIPAIGGDSRTEGFSGADLAALVREAGLAVVRELMIMEKDKSSKGQAFMSNMADGNDKNSIEQDSSIASISSRHFETALTKVRPSVAPVDRMRYERVHQYIKEGMGAIQALTAAAAFKPSSSSTR